MTFLVKPSLEQLLCTPHKPIKTLVTYNIKQTHHLLQENLFTRLMELPFLKDLRRATAKGKISQLQDKKRWRLRKSNHNKTILGFHLLKKLRLVRLLEPPLSKLLHKFSNQITKLLTNKMLITWKSGTSSQIRQMRKWRQIMLLFKNMKMFQKMAHWISSLQGNEGEEHRIKVKFLTIKSKSSSHKGKKFTECSNNSTKRESCLELESQLENVKRTRMAASLRKTKENLAETMLSSCLDQI